jgi:hypothetical protein
MITASAGPFISPEYKIIDPENNSKDALESKQSM